MAAVELPGLRRVAYGVVVAQLVLTVLIALVCLVLWSRNTALSAAMGGGIGAAANFVLALVVFRKTRRELAELVRAFYVGEAAKIVVTIVLFVLVLATLKRMLVPGALFGAFAASFLVQWFVLPRAMRRLDGGQV
ncbi:MAG: ATP synthase subunit I [Steroidobacteraceae bacterium]